MPTAKRRKATKSNTSEPVQHPRCDKCHHLPFGANVFVALSLLMMVTLSMLVLSSTNLLEEQAAEITALLSDRAYAQK
jgi:hypothetical protein